MKKLISESEEDTKLIGKEFATRLNKGDVVVLTGELGAGKTKFTEGILQFYKLDAEISSPTFNIVNEYSNESVIIYHFDVYRLEDEEEFYAIGGEEYFEKGICLIEWGEMFAGVLPNKYIQVSFSRNLNRENEREIIIEEINK